MPRARFLTAAVGRRVAGRPPPPPLPKSDRSCPLNLEGARALVALPLCGFAGRTALGDVLALPL